MPYRTFLATRNVKVSIGQVGGVHMTMTIPDRRLVQYDGLHVVGEDGVAYPAPNMRAAIQHGWFIGAGEGRQLPQPVNPKVAKLDAPVVLTTGPKPKLAPSAWERLTGEDVL
jgi:hypothetical protein